MRKVHAIVVAASVVALAVSGAYAQSTVTGVKTVVQPRIAKSAPTEVRAYQPAQWGPLCPTRVIAGDREFGGHGPEIWLTADAYVTPDNAVEVRVTMRARETSANWSETAGTWTRRLTQPEMKVKRILSDTHSEAHYVSRRAGMQIAVPMMTSLADVVPSQRGLLVNQFFTMGDTGGDDISTDDNCTDDTSVLVRFNEMKLETYL